ncbi:hypothetical protein [Desulfonatronum lacustre]|uniref:hypothetical protein n=1 Tax=Desulfonatronum lacustre TaxID=66849 RepID=UPI0004B871D6|nr:hypothetical protein [Desulfonatronum lacustre]
MIEIEIEIGKLPKIDFDHDFDFDFDDSWPTLEVPLEHAAIYSFEIQIFCREQNGPSPVRIAFLGCD